jgi:hypothetical protein
MTCIELEAFASGTGMVHAMDALEPLAGYVSVNLGGGNVGMPQHGLQRPEVGTVLQ